MFEHWAPAVTTSVLLAAVFWLCRKLIAVRLTATVKHEFDQKLETIKSELVRKNGELESLRSTVLQVVSGNQAHLSTRRLVAIDQVIRSMQALKENAMLVQTLAVLKLDYLLEHAGDAKVANFLETIGRPHAAITESLARSREAELSRPFISPWAWALYSAYSGVITHEIARMAAIRAGQDPSKLITTEKMIAVLRTALPDMAAQIDQQGISVFPMALEKLENELAQELQKVASGKVDDVALLARAAAVIDGAQKLTSSLAQAEAKVPDDAK